MVRRLHPDTQREMTAQKTEWWHQAQAAYEAGDLEQLEVILTLCEIGDSGTTAHTSASLLQRITAKLKSSLREIKRQIADSGTIRRGIFPPVLLKNLILAAQRVWRWCC